MLVVGLPPLRERPGDMEVLINHFLAEYARRMDQPAKKLSPEARALIMRYGWPGNVRQLKNVMERVAILAPNREISASDVLNYVASIFARGDTKEEA